MGFVGRSASQLEISVPLFDARESHFLMICYLIVSGKL